MLLPNPIQCFFFFLRCFFYKYFIDYLDSNHLSEQTFTSPGILSNEYETWSPPWPLGCKAGNQNFRPCGYKPSMYSDKQDLETTRTGVQPVFFHKWVISKEKSCNKTCRSRSFIDLRFFLENQMVIQKNIQKTLSENPLGNKNNFRIKRAS